MGAGIDKRDADLRPPQIGEVLGQSARNQLAGELHTSGPAADHGEAEQAGPLGRVGYPGRGLELGQDGVAQAKRLRQVVETERGLGDLGMPVVIVHRLGGAEPGKARSDDHHADLESAHAGRPLVAR
jgi:hypothetical protein